MRPGGVLIAAAFLGLASSAAFATPPAGDNVLVIRPLQVGVPARLPGACRVVARVQEVLDGGFYRAGDPVTLEVPCLDGKPRLEYLDPRRPGSGPRRVGVDPVVLRKLPKSVVHLDDAARLIWTPTQKSYPRLGRISGYRVIDGVGVLVM
jgi:hypothetical protein